MLIPKPSINMRISFILQYVKSNASSSAAAALFVIWVCLLVAQYTKFPFRNIQQSLSDNRLSSELKNASPNPSKNHSLCIWYANSFES